jgi:3-methyladenine DNA glycosylase AlkD
VTVVAADELFQRVHDALAASADPAKAGPMARYMKDRFVYFGVASPQRRRIQRDALRGLAPLDQVGLTHLARRCWAADERELQYLACDVLARHIKVCGPDFLLVAEELIRSKSWWDTVDALAAHVVGPLVAATPHLVRALDRWLADDDIWIARAAILHQLAYKNATDRERLFRYCLARADHKDFFIRKAIGWALREYAWTDPDAVAAFVEAHRSALSPLSVREALKNIAK